LRWWSASPLQKNVRFLAVVTNAVFAPSTFLIQFMGRDIGDVISVQLEAADSTFRRGSDGKR
jgi:hypothetical protein